MKRVVLIVSTFFLLSVNIFAQSKGLFSTNSVSIADIQEKLEYNAFTEYPVPLTGNFLERKLIYEWTKRWNKPDTVCYVYIFIGSSCIGYFVTHGKPASTQSYLLPEHKPGYTDRETPDVDGTYGTNNPGYRFFLANGTAVECSGTMVSCVYSDAPLSLSAVEIKSVKTK